MKGRRQNTFDYSNKSMVIDNEASCEHAEFVYGKEAVYIVFRSIASFLIIKSNKRLLLGNGPKSGFVTVSSSFSYYN